VIAKQAHVTLGSEDHITKIILPRARVVECGLTTKLLRMIAMLSRVGCAPDRRQEEESYIPRKPREDESRLEFQRFLHW
jgi:hypothetical protein